MPCFTKQKFTSNPYPERKAAPFRSATPSPLFLHRLRRNKKIVDHAQQIIAHSFVGHVAVNVQL